MKILLINPEENLVSRAPIYPAMSLLLLGTMLERSGHEVAIRHFFPGTWGLDGLERLTADFRPGIVGMTMNTFQVRHAREISETVKRISGDTVVVAGGAHPTVLKQELFQRFQNVDAAVAGDGEFAILDLAAGKNWSGISGLVTREFCNEPVMADDLDYVPPPNLNLVENLKLFKGNMPAGKLPSMCVSGSRGCPFRCNFCSESVVGNKLRYRSPGNIIAELEYLIKFGIKDVLFTDDTFNANKKWAMSVYQAIIDSGLNKRLDFRTSFRANENLVDREILMKAKEAGVWIVFYGVESGNPDMLRHMGKKITVQEIVRTFDMTHELKLKTVSAFMFGNVGDSRETLRDSVRLAKRLRSFLVGFSIAIPLPGTKFMEDVAAKGHLLEKDFEKYDMMNCVVRTDTLTRDDILRLFSRTTFYIAVTQLIFGRNRKYAFFEVIRRLSRKIKSMTGRMH